jgi:hypothetical protein
LWCPQWWGSVHAITSIIAECTALLQWLAKLWCQRQAFEACPRRFSTIRHPLRGSERVIHFSPKQANPHFSTAHAPPRFHQNFGGKSRGGGGGGGVAAPSSAARPPKPTGAASRRDSFFPNKRFEINKRRPRWSVQERAPGGQGAGLTRVLYWISRALRGFPGAWGGPGRSGGPCRRGQRVPIPMPGPGAGWRGRGGAGGAGRGGLWARAIKRGDVTDTGARHPTPGPAAWACVRANLLPASGPVSVLVLGQNTSA